MLLARSMSAFRRAVVWTSDLTLRHTEAAMCSMCMTEVDHRGPESTGARDFPFLLDCITPNGELEYSYPLFFILGSVCKYIVTFFVLQPLRSIATVIIATGTYATLPYRACIF